MINLRMTICFLMLALTASIWANGSSDESTKIAGERIKIEFWHSFTGVGEEAINEIIVDFEASQDLYAIEPVYTGNYDDTIIKLQSAIPAGTQPPLALLEVTRYGLLADLGILEDLRPYMKKSGTDSRIRHFALEVSQYKGINYVLPFNTSTPVMYYNKDHFRSAGLDPENPPVSWDELKSAARVLTIKGEKEVEQWGIASISQWIRWAFVKQNGGDWVDPQNNIIIDQKEAVEAYQWISDLVNVERVYSPSAAISEDTGKQYFLSGRASILFGSTGSLGNLSNTEGLDLGVAPLPGHKTFAVPVGGATLGILSSSSKEHKEGAWAFINHALTPEMNGLWFAATGYLPIVVGAEKTPRAAERIASNPHYSVAISQLDVAFGRARPPFMPNMRKIEPNIWSQIVLEQKTTKQALSALKNELEANN